VKLLFPVTGVIFLSGMCCCGDFMEGLQSGMEGGTPVVTDEAATDGAPAGSATSGGATALGGTCGRFADWSIAAPSGWNVMACTDDGTNGSLTLMGGSDPAAGCKAVRDWAEGKGFSKTSETEAMGTTAITLEKDAARMTLGCTGMAGQNTVAIVLSPK
jgi:hypothetical protein